MTVADRIKELRTEKGITQTELAKRLGNKDKSTISKIESKGNDISLKDINRIAEALGTTASYLMGWEDDEGARALQSYSPEVAELLIKVKGSPELLRFVDHYLRLSKENQDLVRKMVDNLMPKPVVKLDRDGTSKILVEKSEITRMIKDALYEKKQKELLDSPYERLEQLHIDNQ